MDLIGFLILGVLIGRLVIWFLAKARSRGIYIRQLAELEGKAKSAEIPVNELRQQAQHKESEPIQKRSELDSEKQLKVEVPRGLKNLKKASKKRRHSTSKSR